MFTRLNWVSIPCGCNGNVTQKHLRRRCVNPVAVDAHAESDATRTLIPIHCGQRSDDRGQLVMTG